MYQELLFKNIVLFCLAINFTHQRRSTTILCSTCVRLGRADILVNFDCIQQDFFSSINFNRPEFPKRNTRWRCGAKARVQRKELCRDTFCCSTRASVPHRRRLRPTTYKNAIHLIKYKIIQVKQRVYFYIII